MSRMHELSLQVVQAARDAGLTVGTAESLTAGLLSAALADIPGASAMLQGGVVAYQNSVKASLLGVPGELLAEAGSVDGQVAAAMAAGVRVACGADVGVSTTGVAGPEPHDGNVVGTVFIGIASATGAKSFGYSFSGSRPAIRSQACEAGLERVLAEIRDVLYRR